MSSLLLLCLNDMKLAMPDFLEAITKDPALDTVVRETPGGGFTFSVRKG